jgi:hypothetical protein
MRRDAMREGGGDDDPARAENPVGGGEEIVGRAVAEARRQRLEAGEKREDASASGPPPISPRSRAA